MISMKRMALNLAAGMILAQGLASAYLGCPRPQEAADLGIYAAPGLFDRL